MITNKHYLIFILFLVPLILILPLISAIGYFFNQSEQSNFLQNESFSILRYNQNLSVVVSNFTYLDFNGINSIVNFTNNTKFNNIENFTIAFWIYGKTLGSSTPYPENEEEEINPHRIKLSFKELKQVNNQRDKNIVKGIINDEKRHLRLLKTIKQGGK